MGGRSGKVSHLCNLYVSHCLRTPVVKTTHTYSVRSLGINELSHIDCDINCTWLQDTAVPETMKERLA